MKNILRTILTVSVISAFLGKGSAQEYVVIVNNSNPIESLTKKQLGNLFLKKSDWGHGIKAEPVDLQARSPIRIRFTREVHGKSVSAIRSYWQQAVFMGMASVPPEKETDGAVVEFVKKSPNAIGYVSPSANIEGVKTVQIH